MEPTERPMAAPFDDTPATRCAYYRGQCALPATIIPGTGRIVLRAGAIVAITMPATLGQSVKMVMGRRGVGGTPIFSHPRAARWSFLARPDLSEDEELHAALLRMNVFLTRSGDDIALPSPADDGALFRKWITPPVNPFRPLAATVVDALDTCKPLYRRPVRGNGDIAPEAYDVTHHGQPRRPSPGR